MTILVTGAAGFIGSNFVLDWFNQSDEDIVSLDLLTYAGSRDNFSALDSNPHHHFEEGDIRDKALISELIKKFQVRAVIHFAAESHVDRSVRGSVDFIETNIVGTYHLLETVREYWSHLSDIPKKSFRFLHISTDEVYGSLEKLDPAFTEKSQYRPNNPYSASKAASDHLVRAWNQTYGLPILTMHCSNNYGPYQFPEKLIPLSIMNALQAKPIAIYGDGQHIRDWLYVKDHCRAIRVVLEKGQLGEAYHVGSQNEKTNLEVVEVLCSILDELKPKADGSSYANQITYVQDRPGHDRRYAIDATKLERELHWKSEENFESGLRKTIQWYLDHQAWVDHVVNNRYKKSLQA
jgi:dTDP-glucose 4,6-dehydratase